jgi:phosphomannomutase
VIFVDRRGQIARPEQIGVILATQCFERPTVVYDLKCASLLPRAVAAAGGTAVMCPSGHGFIKQALLQRRAELGVEVSGHHFFGALGGGDDGLFTTLVLCRLLHSAGQSLDGLLAPLVWPAITPDLRFAFTGDSAAVLEAIVRGCRGPISRLDGVRAEYDGGWALARASITESALTLRFEGRDRIHVRQLAARFLAPVPELRDRALAALDSTP